MSNVRRLGQGLRLVKNVNFTSGRRPCCQKRHQSRTQSNACARARMALALGKLNFSCAVIGLTFVHRACRQRTGTPKFRGSSCQFPQSQCHPSPRTGIALGTRLKRHLLKLTSISRVTRWHHALKQHGIRIFDVCYLQ